jgi:DNA polymerase-3 subunit epsilon
MSGHWSDGRQLLIDTETTGTNPETARLVTGCAILTDPTVEGGIRWRKLWLADAGGEDIPEQATKIHGISTEKAHTEGRPVADVVGEIADFIWQAWGQTIPVVAFNAPYDLKIIDREMARAGGRQSLMVSGVGPVLDPLVIDKACVKKRRGAGARKLTSLAAVYKVRQDTAHTADGDALTCGRVLWRQTRQFADTLRPMDLSQMQVWQATQHRVWADEFGAYLQSVGKTDDVDRVWPWAPAPAQEGVQA